MNHLLKFNIVACILFVWNDSNVCVNSSFYLVASQCWSIHWNWNHWYDSSSQSKKKEHHMQIEIQLNLFSDQSEYVWFFFQQIKCQWTQQTDERDQFLLIVLIWTSKTIADRFTSIGNLTCKLTFFNVFCGYITSSFWTQCPMIHTFSCYISFIGNQEHLLQW